MDLRVTHNLAASMALGSYRTATTHYNQVSERLATGLRVNNASDGVSLFAGQTALRSQLAGISAAQQNTLVARNHLDAAQGGLNSILTNLNKLRQTYLRALGPDVTQVNGSTLQNEADLLIDAIDNIANNTQVGGNKILNGSGDFRITETDGAFDKVQVNVAKFGHQEASRTVNIDVTQAAERATILTNLDLASLQMAEGNGAYVTISGEGGSNSVHVSQDTSAASLVSRINETAGKTGVYASSFITSASESNITTFDITAGAANDELQITGGNTFNFTVDGVTVSGTATEDLGGGDFRIQASDLQAALNTAGVGHFTVLGGTDTGNSERNLIVRRAGNTGFNITGFTAATGAIHANLAATTISSAAGGPATSRIVSEGASLTGAQSFGIDIYQNGGVWDQTIDIASVDEAGFDAGLAGIADATFLGVNERGQDVFLFEATGDTDAFRFKELSSTDITARSLGLLSNSGGGNGLASRGMAVLGLYSEDFGSNNAISLSIVGDESVQFGELNVANSDAGNFGVGSIARGIGVDAAVSIDGRSVYGNGWDFGFSANGLDFDFTLSKALGKGSFSNTINRAAAINQDTALDDFLIGFRPVTEGYGDGSGGVGLYSYGDLEALLTAGTVNNPQFTEDRTDGVIDSLSFTVHRKLGQYGPRSGLGVQLTGENGGREYIGIQSFDISNLGAGPQAENGDSVSSELDSPAEAISQLRREGKYNLIDADPIRVSKGLEIIERAIQQTISTQTRLGTYQTQTLDRNADWLSMMENNIAASLAQVESTDAAVDITKLSQAQIRVQATTSLLAQANQIPQTLLTLLR